MTHFRLYANRAGGGSWSRVAAGCEAGLRAHGALAGFHDAGADELDGGSSPEGHAASVGLAIGEPGVWPMPHQLGSHEHKLALVAPNSTWVPPYLRSLCQQEGLTGVVAPSRWAQSLLASELEVPVHLWQHGIDTDALYPDKNATAAMVDHPFTVLHLCSCGTPGQRKGTAELLEAWSQLDAAGSLGDHDLLIVVAPDVVAGVPLQQRVEQLGIAKKVRLCGRINGSAGTMREHYQRAHLLCQPSRAEGFGLCLLRGTVVTTKRGGVPIEDVTIWDEVVGRDGAWHRVAATAARKTKRVLRVRAQGCPDLSLTRQHCVLAAERLPGEKIKRFAAEAQLRWVPAGSLTSDHYLVLRGPTAQVSALPAYYSLEAHCESPIVDGERFTSRYSNRCTCSITAATLAKQVGCSVNDVRTALQPSQEHRRQDLALRERIRSEAERVGYFEHQRVWLPRQVMWTPEWCRLLGYYAGDGCRTDGAVEWALNDSTKTLPAQHICATLKSLGLSWRVQRRGPHGLNIFCSSTILARALTDLCGRRARSKCVPLDALMTLPDACRAAVLEGLYRTDGHNGHGTLALATISPTLALQARDLWLSLGIPAGLKQHRANARAKGRLGPVRRHGKIIKSKRLSWLVRVSGRYYESACTLLGITPRRNNKTKRVGSEFVQCGNVWLARVRDVSTMRTNLPVHDLEVPTSGCFVASGVVVHNSTLEARASGVPIVATACTGHADHLEGVASIIVRHGPAAPIDDGPGALAPTVSPHEIAEALSYAKSKWLHLAVAAFTEADSVRRRWSWARTTKEFLDAWM